MTWAKSQIPMAVGIFKKANGCWRVEVYPGQGLGS